MIVTQIVAMAENRVIGADGDLPWRLSEDLKFFKATTSGHALIMGRKTYDSIGRPLPGRLNIVVTRSPRPDAEGLVHVTSLDEAFAVAAREAGRWGEEVFVAGGGEIYRAALPRTDKIWLTHVLHAVRGDTTYPEMPPEFSPGETQAFSEPFPYTRTLYQRAPAPRP